MPQVHGSPQPTVWSAAAPYLRELLMGSVGAPDTAARIAAQPSSLHDIGISHPAPRYALWSFVLWYTNNQQYQDIRSILGSGLVLNGDRGDRLSVFDHTFAELSRIVDGTCGPQVYSELSQIHTWAAGLTQSMTAADNLRTQAEALVSSDRCAAARPAIGCCKAHDMEAYCGESQAKVRSAYDDRPFEITSFRCPTTAVNSPQSQDVPTVATAQFESGSRFPIAGFRHVVQTHPPGKELPAWVTDHVLNDVRNGCEITQNIMAHRR